MAVMTAQPPLPLPPADAHPIGAAAAIIEDDDGGRVFVHGNLAYAWDDSDTAGRRFAAVSLMRIKAATQLEVAAAFAVRPATLRRWDAQHSDAGVAGLLGERKGPKRKSKLTGDTVAAIRRLRAGGASCRAVAAATGVSEGSVRNAVKPAGADVDSDEPCVPTGSDDPLPQEQEQEQEQEVGVEAEPEVDVGPEPEPDSVDGCFERSLAGW
jgi:transposase